MSFPKYPKYKDSGVEWLGEVPKGWDVATIKRLSRLQSGNSITAERIESEGRYPVYGGNGLRGFTDSYTHDGEFALIGRQGALCGNINYANDQFWASEHAVVAEPLTPYPVRWFGELLRAMDLGQYSIASAQPGLAVDAIRNLRVPIPSDDEKKHIALFLDQETAKIDALIEEQRRLIELLKEKRQAVISHAVTKGLDPSLEMKGSGIEWVGDIPHHWSICPVKELARPGTKTFIDGDWVELPFITDQGIRLIQTGNVGIGFYKEQGYKYISEESFKQLKCTEIFRLEILICRLDGPVGRACLVPDLEDRMITSVDNAILKPRADVEPRYVVYLMSSKPWLDWIGVLCRVGGGFRVRISRKMLGELLIPRPGFKEQFEIADYLDKKCEELQQLILASESNITLLQERRSALISAAVTGKIDVRDYKPQDSAIAEELYDPA